MILLFIGCLILSIILHELGHLIFLKVYTKIDHQFELSTFSINYNPKDLSKKQEIKMILGGVILGVLPIFFFNNIIYSIAFFFCYLAGCKHDLIKTWRITK